MKGGYVAYFSARSKATGKNVIGAAFAKNVTGPWVDSGKPLVSLDHSAIDVHLFTDPDSGRNFLFWKVELFTNGKSDDVIRGQEVGPDGVSLVGAAPPSGAATTVLRAGLGSHLGQRHELGRSRPQLGGPRRGRVAHLLPRVPPDRGTPRLPRAAERHDQRHLLSAQIGFADGWPKIGAKL